MGKVCSLPNPGWTHSKSLSSQGLWGWPWPHRESCCRQRVFAVQFCRTDPVNDLLLHLFHRGAVSEFGLNIQGCFLDMHEFSLIVCLHAVLCEDLNFMWQMQDVNLHLASKPNHKNKIIWFML